ncbi:hypothetical protein FHX11_001997 [Rhizobium sp. BK602]|nr:hypothetical protein [Rhizobium sp. BK602]
MGTPSEPVVKIARRSHDGMIPESSLHMVRAWFRPPAIAFPTMFE